MAISTFVFQIQLFITNPFLDLFSFPFNTNDYMNEKRVSRRLFSVIKYSNEACKNAWSILRNMDLIVALLFFVMEDRGK